MFAAETMRNGYGRRCHLLAPRFVLHSRVPPDCVSTLRRASASLQARPTELGRTRLSPVVRLMHWVRVPVLHHCGEGPFLSTGATHGWSHMVDRRRPRRWLGRRADHEGFGIRCVVGSSSWGSLGCAIIGGYLFGMLGVAAGGGLVASIIVAIIGACVLIGLSRLFSGRRSV